MSRPITTPKQIDDWRRANSETEHLEFKEAKAQFDFDRLLQYCVAIANEGAGVLLLGIANKPPRPVVGSNAYLNVTKTAEDLFQRLHFRVDVEEVQHPDGRVVVFHIPSRPLGHPHQVDGAYGPKGSGKRALYSLLRQKRDDLFEQQNILLAAGEAIRGKPVFEALVTDPPSSEEQFRGLWKLYFLSFIETSGPGGRLRAGPSASRLQTSTRLGRSGHTRP